MTSEFFWGVVFPAYAAGYVASAMFFTRHWHTNTGCSAKCTYISPRYRDDTSSGKHAEDCNKWRKEPLDPGDSMFTAIIWPLALFNYVLTIVHNYVPKPKRLTPQQYVALTSIQLEKITSTEQLDRVLSGKEAPPSE